MSEKRGKRQRPEPEPPLGPNFPDLTHPDLGLKQTQEVDKPPNTGEVEPDADTPEPPG